MVGFSHVALKNVYIFKVYINTYVATPRCLNKSTLDNSPAPLLKLSENWLLTTSRTILRRIYGKLLKLSRPQDKINDAVT